ncbi:hypothetical protein F5I97DRAFT_161244 [Phlebopus sp. FC_14]|nr:hypothetical protein F5I97DRAFT_161244 [Phlebopus sp. FC_14]
MPGREQRHEIMAGLSSPSPSSSSLASPATASSSASSSPRHRSSTLRPPKKPARLNLVQLPLPQSESATPAVNATNEFPACPLSPSLSSHSPIPTIPSTFLKPTLASSNGVGHRNGHVSLRSTSTFSSTSHPLPQSPTLTVPDHPPASPTNPSSGLRAHFSHLLPRHAVFLVRLTVHELHNVPLVHGEFGVRWKVKGVTSPSSGGIFGKAKGRTKGKSKLVSGEATREDKGKEIEISHSGGSDKVWPTARDSDVDDVSLLDVSASVSDAHSIANSSSTHSYSYDHSLGYYDHNPHGHPYHTSNEQMMHSLPQPHPHALSIPSVIISANSPVSPPTPMARSVSGASSNAGARTSPSSYHTSPPNSSLNPARSNLQRSASYLSADWHPQVPSKSSSFGMHPPNSCGDEPRTLLHSHPSEPVPTLASTPPPDGYTPSKGRTPFMKLKEHNVTWEQTLDFVIQMKIGRERDKGEKGELNAREAKLVVMQRVIPGDPDAPHNPRLGVVYINLAQYVDAGVVTRRYLLRQSKTNATLKLTVRVEHTAGSTAYTAPPLPKGEILSGVAGLLESSDAYRTRFRTLDLYRDVLSNSSSEGEDPSDASSALSLDDSTHVENKGRGRHEKRKHGNKKRPPFDFTKLPSINDPRGTEKLIEALFNPAPVMSPRLIGPFTYLVGAERGAELDGGNGGDGELDQISLDDEGKFEPDPEGLEVDEDAGASLYADAREEIQQNSESESDYRSIASYHSASCRGSLSRNIDKEGESLGKKSLRSVGSRMRLQLGDGVESENAGSASGVEGSDRTTGIRGARLGWWQKLKPGSA